MENNRSVLSSAAALFAWTVAATLASYAAVEVVRRYHHFLDDAIDGLEAETHGAVAQVRRAWRIHRETRSGAPFVLYEAYQATADAAPKVEGEKP